MSLLLLATHSCFIALPSAKPDVAPLHAQHVILNYLLLQRSAEGSVWAVQEEGESGRRQER